MAIFMWRVLGKILLLWVGYRSLFRFQSTIDNDHASVFGQQGQRILLGHSTTIGGSLVFGRFIFCVGALFEIGVMDDKGT